MDHLQLAWRGATLTERLCFVRHRPPDDRPLDFTLLGRWARVFARGDRPALERRLQWDGADPTLAVAALSPDPPVGLEEPPWIDAVRQLLEETHACTRMLATPAWRAEMSRLVSGKEPPFIEAWIPGLRVARRWLRSRLPDLDRLLCEEAVSHLECHLVNEAAAMGALAVFEDFSRFRERGAQPEGRVYDEYVAQLLEGRFDELLEHHPVLARQLARLIGQWTYDVAALATRLEADRAAIEATFGAPAGRVRRLVPGLSDRHAGGRTVARLEFESGLCLAYKPREVAVEQAFHAWLAWLSRNGLPDVPRPLRVLDRGTHGWVEWVEQAKFRSRDAVRAYFRSAGVLACLVHVLGASDLHAENLVASSGGPVLVDTEMLLQPAASAVRVRIGEAQEIQPDAGSTSCLLPGLVSLVIVGSGDAPFDVGGLQPAPARETGLPLRRWVNLRRGDLRYVAVGSVRPMLANDVRLNGRLQRPEAFAAELREGFASAYRFLRDNRDAILAPEGPLERFAACQVRVLFRPSDQYGALQYLLAAPRYQRSGVDRSLALETLLRLFAHEPVRPALWPLVADERQQLEDLDIPRLSLPAGSCDLTAASGEVIRGFYSESGLDGTKRRLRSLSRDDLAYQLDQLGTALRGTSTRAAKPRRMGQRDAAIAVGEEIATSAVAGPRGRLQWAGCQGRVDLYSGVAGIAVFLAALAATTRSAVWRDRARGALLEVEASLAATSPDVRPRLGACSGVPSIAYALALAGQLLDEPAWADRAVTLVRAIPDDVIDCDTVLDVEGGVAGMLMVLIALDAACKDGKLRPLAGRCAARLAATQVAGGGDDGAWPAGADRRARPGFAHGVAGIAFALSAWAVIDPAPVWVAAVRRAWSYERRVYTANAGTWPAVRGDGGRVAMAAWCHGAPGIGLARALTPPGMADEGVAAEAEAAISQTLAAPLGQLDHVCCGNLARAEAALTAGIALERDEWIAGSRLIAAEVVRRVATQGKLGLRAQGVLRRAPVPGFFQGLAGIGYELLRIEEPDVLPSVLAFELPPHQRVHIAR